MRKESCFNHAYESLHVPIIFKFRGSSHMLKQSSTSLDRVAGTSVSEILMILDHKILSKIWFFHFCNQCEIRGKKTVTFNVERYKLQSNILAR